MSATCTRYRLRAAATRADYARVLRGGRMRQTDASLLQRAVITVLTSENKTDRVIRMVLGYSSHSIKMDSVLLNG